MKKGFIPAAYTPFHADFSINVSAIPQIGQLYTEQSISTVFINGTTGEFSSLTTREREELAEAWIDATDLEIWIHVGHTSQFEAVRLARHAQQRGAAAISALAPYYFTPGTEKDLIDYLSPIARAASALPFYYYHIPSMTGVTLNLPLIASTARDVMPNFAGIKYSSMDLYTLQAIHLATATKGAAPLHILFGVDEMLLSALPVGLAGAIGSTYNFATPLYRKMLAAQASNNLDLARSLQLLSVSVVRLFHRYGGISAGKAIMEMLGVPCGPARPPLPALSLEDRLHIYNSICDLDIFPSSPRSPVSES